MTLADVGSLRLKREAVDVPVLVTSSLAAFRAPRMRPVCGW